ncbi:putative phage integrase (plasmid) [Sinorhizobium fredii NGR234]|uniref:Phage integrase n=1 Tax=Sinorhizobium fredii (strain NBRC 101917 / NGR234) TaxID=394 RepID=C3KQV8_SINFN|nr:putative phage integrase [Sinorhizobium fredii NGR234]
MSGRQKSTTVQKQLGHASAEMTPKYQRRRDSFQVNLTKASGL